MSSKFSAIKMGLALVFLGLLFGIGQGISFGFSEDTYKQFVADGISANPQLHDEKSQDKIWRYAQRAHFHSTGIGAFSIGLLILTMFSNMKENIKRTTALLIGLGSFYPFSWMAMFLLAPSIGRGPAHHHIITESFTYIGVGGLLAGMVLLIFNIFFNTFANNAMELKPSTDK